MMSQALALILLSKVLKIFYIFETFCIDAPRDTHALQALLYEPQYRFSYYQNLHLDIYIHIQL